MLPDARCCRFCSATVETALQVWEKNNYSSPSEGRAYLGLYFPVLTQKGLQNASESPKLEMHMPHI